MVCEGKEKGFARIMLQVGIRQNKEIGGIHSLLNGGKSDYEVISMRFLGHHDAAAQAGWQRVRRE